MKVTNSLLSLLNVPLWVKVFPTKVMFAMILVLTNFIYLVMLFSLRINISFLQMITTKKLIFSDMYLVAFLVV
jgi:hypothetical protein